MLKRVVDFTLINPIMKWFVKRCCFCSFWGHLLRFCFAIFHSIVPSADIQRSGLLESRALKFGMFLWGVPAGPRSPRGPRGVWTGGRPFSLAWQAQHSVACPKRFFHESHWQGCANMTQWQKSWQAQHLVTALKSRGSLAKSNTFGAL